MAMIDEDDCAVCVPFDQEWIFTYGDLVTLLLCFFILLFSMCKMDVEKFKDVANSFKPLAAQSPYMNQGQDTLMQKLMEQIEESELAEETEINVEDRGLVVSFESRVFFEKDSAQLSEKGQQELAKFAKLLYFLPDKILVEGHTDNRPVENAISKWELSGARASNVAQFLVREGVPDKRITVKAYAGYKPRFRNDNPEQAELNNRVEVLVLPQEEG